MPIIPDARRHHRKPPEHDPRGRRGETGPGRDGRAAAFPPLVPTFVDVVTEDAELSHALSRALVRSTATGVAVSFARAVAFTSDRAGVFREGPGLADWGGTLREGWSCPRRYVVVTEAAELSVALALALVTSIKSGIDVSFARAVAFTSDRARVLSEGPGPPDWGGTLRERWSCPRRSVVVTEAAELSVALALALVTSIKSGIDVSFARAVAFTSDRARVLSEGPGPPDWSGTRHSKRCVCAGLSVVITEDSELAPIRPTTSGVFFARAVAVTSDRARVLSEGPGPPDWSGTRHSKRCVCAGLSVVITEDSELAPIRPTTSGVAVSFARAVAVTSDRAGVLREGPGLSGWGEALGQGLSCAPRRSVVAAWKPS